MPNQAAMETRVDEIVVACAGLEGPLLPILHAVQHEYGFIPEGAIPRIAEGLNLGRAEVHGVVSFYHDFRKAPAGATVVKICRAEACQARGADAAIAAAEKRLGVAMGETSKDGSVTLEPVFCLGLCACGPAAMVGERLVGNLTGARLDAVLDGVKA